MFEDQLIEVYVLVPSKVLEEKNAEEIEPKDVELHFDHPPNRGGDRVLTFISNYEHEDELERVKDDVFEEARDEGFDDGYEEAKREDRISEEELAPEVIENASSYDKRLLGLKAETVAEELKLQKIHDIFKKLTDKEIDEVHEKYVKSRY